DAAGGLERGLGEVIEDAGLVDDDVPELADGRGIVRRPGDARDVRRVLRVGLPEGRFGDPIRLRLDSLAEAERLEGLHRARLDAVGLSDLEATAALLDDAGIDGGEPRKLRGKQHARRAGADDEDVHLVGELADAVDAVP